VSELLASLRLDLEHAKRGYRRYAAYPGATYAGLLTNTVFGFMRMFVLLAMLAGRQEIAGYDQAAVITYTWLTQALLATVYFWGWQDLGLRIRTGDIATDLIRPVHPLRAGLAFDLGRAAYHALFRGLPPLAIGAVLFGIVAPTDPPIAAAFAISCVLANVVSYAYRVLYNLASFWLLDWRGTMLLAIIVSSFLSGSFVPVSFFPPALHAVAVATPFPSMLQVPIDIFVGRTAGPDVIAALATQLAWAVALVALAAWLFGRGVRRLVVQGG
jgi:ABC-2 type transport system permease protein